MTARQPGRRCQSENAQKVSRCVGRQRLKPVNGKRLAPAWLAVFVAGCCLAPVRAADQAPFVVSDSRAAPLVTKLFSRTNGWIGADAAYSVPLDRKKVLWT